MNISSIIVQTTPKYLNEVVENLKNCDVCDYHMHDELGRIIITAGQDRRCAIYTSDKKNSYYKEASFLIYSAALSPSAKLAAYASDEENNVTVFNTNTKENLYTLTQNKSTLTNILFLNENELFVASDDKEINYYKID